MYSTSFLAKKTPILCFVVVVVVTVVFLFAKERDRTGKLWQWMNLGVKFLRPVVVNGRLPLHTVTAIICTMDLTAAVLICLPI